MINLIVGPLYEEESRRRETEGTRWRGDGRMLKAMILKDKKLFRNLWPEIKGMCAKAFGGDSLAVLITSCFLRAEKRLMSQMPLEF